MQQHSGMTFNSRTVNVVNLKFVAVNTFSVLEVRTQTLGNAAPCQESTEAIHENSLNIDEIIDPELHLTHVKVLTLWPSGRTDVQARGRKEDTLYMDLTVKKCCFKELASRVVNQETFKPKILKALWRVFNSEFK